jgi:hypothetical protein
MTSRKGVHPGAPGAASGDERSRPGGVLDRQREQVVHRGDELTAFRAEAEEVLRNAPPPR